MEKYYIEYGEEIFRFLRRMLGSREDAEDILEETFITLFKIDNVDERSLKKFLYRIAYTRAVDFLRKKRRRKEALERINYSVKEDRKDPVEIEEALMTLKERERVALLLFYEDGYRYEEISDIMGVPLGTVKTLIHRGKERLRSYFKGEKKDG